MVNMRLKRALAGVCGSGGALRDLVSRVREWACEHGAVLGCLGAAVFFLLVVILLAVLFAGSNALGLAVALLASVVLVLLCAVMGG